MQKGTLLVMFAFTDATATTTIVETTVIPTTMELLDGMFILPHRVLENQ